MHQPINLPVEANVSLSRVAESGESQRKIPHKWGFQNRRQEPIFAPVTKIDADASQNRTEVLKAMQGRKSCPNAIGSKNNGLFDLC